MDELDFDHHLNEVRPIIDGTKNEETRTYFAHQAEHMHALTVHDALRDMQMEAIMVTEKLTNEDAVYFLRFGAGRRFGMMWAAYRGILQRVLPNRTEPMRNEDVQAVSRDLNMTYLNILGVIDNYAWALRNHCSSEHLKQLHPTRIGLFVADFIDDPELVPIKKAIEPLRAWFTQLREKRDPAAHRIPLSVPPAILNPEEAKRYRDIEDEISAALRRFDFEGVERLRERQERIGTFVPQFLHHPKEALTPIYPTVPQDIANLIRLIKSVHVFMHSRRST